jgi:hypothetical protein
MARHHHHGKAAGAESAASAEREPPMTKPDTPFQRHWLYYILLKYGVLIVAVLLGLYVAYLL